MCNVGALITNGLIRLGDLSDEPEELFSAEYVSLHLVIYHQLIPFVL